MKLSEIFPVDETVERVAEDAVLTHYDVTQLDEICRLKRRIMVDIGSSIGYHLKVARPETNLERFSDAYVNEDPRMYQAIADSLGEPTLLDVDYQILEVADDQAEHRTVAELLVAVVYPNALHIGDVQFSHPRRPIPPHQRTRRFTYYKGLGLLEVLVDNCIGFARESGLEAICLTPAESDLVPVFEEVGFSLDDNELADLMRRAGMPGPMSMRV